MCPKTSDVETQLPADSTAPGLARRFLHLATCPAHHATVLEPSVLLVSELVTNAVIHGAPPITVRVHCDESHGLEASVSDGSFRAPFLRDADLRHTSGHGIALVDTISDAWGVMPTEIGKVVWFRLSA